jgi:uncharacterized protein (UPF0548 family)
MYVDSQLELSDSQAVTSTAISSNVIDLFGTNLGAGAQVAANVIQDIGQGEDVYLVVQTAVACTDTSSDATLTITLETDTAVGLGSSTVVLNLGTLAFAAFATAGTVLARVKLPSFDYKRYLGLRYTVAAGPLTAGAFDAFITNNIQNNKIYKSGFTVQ